MKAIWSDEAKKNADVTSDIEKKFTEKESAAFIEETFAIIDLIEKFPKLNKKSTLKGLKKIHQALIHPHTTLFYQISKQRIESNLYPKHPYNSPIFLVQNVLLWSFENKPSLSQNYANYNHIKESNDGS